MVPKLDIIVEDRGADFKAYVASNPDVWEAGRTDVEAIGKLMLQRGLGVRIFRGAGEWNSRLDS